MNQAKKQKTIERHNLYKDEALKEFEKLKNNPLFLTGLAIYWGEGEKANKGRVSVVNSDSTLIKTVAVFFRKCLMIPEEKLRAALFIYEDHDEVKLKDFWSKELGISKTQFIKTQILPSRSNHTKNKMSKGICTLYFSSTEMRVKILKWIELLSNSMGGSLVGPPAKAMRD